MRNEKNMSQAIYQKSKSQENCRLPLSQHWNAKPLSSRKWPGEVRKPRESYMQSAQSLQKRRQRFIKVLVKRQVRLLSKCKLRKLTLRNFSTSEKCQALTRQNVSTNKAFNLQSTCWSSVIYTLRKKTRCEKKVGRKQHLRS